MKTINAFTALPVAGFDVSDRSVKYLKLRGESGKISPVEFFGEIEIPEGLLEDGEIKKEDEFAAALKQKLAKDKFGRKLKNLFLAVSLPEEKSFLRLIQLPKVEIKEAGNAVRWEIENHVPIPPEELIYDYEIFEPPENMFDHLDVVITAFPRKIVESYVNVLKNSGLRVCALELESQAIVRSLAEDMRSRTVKIAVDMGRNRTSFIIFAGGTIVFTSTIALGGITLEENLAKELGISPEKALSLKKDTGLKRISPESAEIWQALVPPLAALADELKRAISYYRSHTQHRHGLGEDISEIILTGGDANLLGLETYLSSSLRLEVKKADPFAAVRKKAGDFIPPLAKNQALAFTTAVGLAMKNLS